jgi:tyrosyl-tRNA synthetase
MNLLKQYKKLATLNVKAEQCTTREEAKKILKKAKKVNQKVGFDRWKSTK